MKFYKMFHNVPAIEAAFVFTPRDVQNLSLVRFGA